MSLLVAGPREPPFKSPSRLVKSSPDMANPLLWHCAQFAFKIASASESAPQATTPKNSHRKIMLSQNLSQMV
jgi:hypothetical protein